MTVQYTMPQGLIAHPVEASNAWNDINHGLSSYCLQAAEVSKNKEFVQP